MPAISVIIPTYNYARFIGFCLESIFAQTYKDFEIIVVDDGSTDDTAEVLKKYEDKIHYIYQPNKGPAVASNAGIKVAKGEYIAFIGSDDLWLPDKLEDQVRVFNEDMKVGIVFSDASSFNENGIISKSILEEENICTGFCFERLFMGNYLIMSTVMIRKACLEKSGLFDEELSSVEDYDLCLRISAFYKIEFVDKILAMRRVHPSNISKNFCQLLDNEIRVIQKIMALHSEKISQMGKKVSIRLCSLFNQHGLEMVEKGKIHEAKKNFFKALMTRPLSIRPYYYLLATMAGKRGFEKLREFKRSWLRLNQ